MIRIAVVGAGIMGANHARILQSLSDCDLVAIVEPDRQRGATLAKSLDVTHLVAAAELVGAVDAVVVATPSERHAEVAVPLLEQGMDVLVEKPIASSLEQAERIVDAARSSDRILMIGHIERFNPAVLELSRLVRSPIHIELTRVGPFSPRVTADVVLDLMIHDLDLALSLAGSDITAVAAVGRRVRTASLDIASALLTFRNGVTAQVTASRAGQNKIRRIEITEAEEFTVVDLIRQDVTIHRVHHSEFLSDEGATYRQSGLVEIPFLEHRGEPLTLELRHFLECSRDRRQPLVGGVEGLAALSLATQVRELAGAGLQA